MKRPTPMTSRRHTGGVVLIEVLIAALLFSLGIMGMVGVSALGVGVQSEARYRTDASTITNDLAQRIWVGVNRTSQATMQASLLTFQHQQTETAAGSCEFTGTDNSTTNPILASWIANTFGGNGMHALPGTAANMYSVAVGTTPADFNRVLITVCWRNATDNGPRRHILETWVN